MTIITLGHSRFGLDRPDLPVPDAGLIHHPAP